jgi:hypothetical protein
LTRFTPYKTSTQSDPFTIAGIWMNPGGFGFQGGAQILNNIVQNNIAGIEFDNFGAIPAKVQFNLIRNNNNPGPGSGNGIEGVVVEDAFGVGPNSNLTVSNNNCIPGNSMNGLRVGHLGYAGAAHSLNATNNWWGAANGPKYNGAGPGTGDNISDPDGVVSFTPFLTSKTGTPCAPPPVGPPTNASQCKDGGWQTFNTPRSFKNQGDCIQYVNTGK